MKPRLVLLELCRTSWQAVPNAELFPFISGYARNQGIPVKWLFMGREGDGRQAIELDHTDWVGLSATLSAFHATHLLVNVTPGPELTRLLEENHRRLRWRAASEDIRTGEDISEMERWLRRPFWTRFSVQRSLEGAKHVADAALPSFACLLANEAAEGLHAAIPIEAGPPSRYAAPIGENPLYQGVDLRKASHDVGTAHRWGGDGTYTHTVPPVELVIRQLRAAVRTQPEERRAAAFVLSSELPLLEMERFVDCVLAENLPPTVLRFACRPDTVADYANEIAAGIRRLKDANHRLEIFDLGLESFAPQENARLNMGVNPRQIQTALLALERWEERWPTTFAFWSLGGPRVVLFTPWTQPEDLALNVDSLERLPTGIPGAPSSLRLRLYPEMPITLLAQKDGLTGSDDDRSPVTAWSRAELPWHFQNPRVAALHRALVALERAASEGTKGTGAGAALLRRLPREERNIRVLAPRLVRTAVANSEMTSSEELIVAMSETIHCGAAPAAKEPPPKDNAGLGRWLETQLPRIIRSLEGRPGAPLKGFRLAYVKHRPGDEWGEVELALGRGEDVLSIYIVPASARADAFEIVGPLALLYAEDGPVEGAELAGVVGAIVWELEGDFA